MWNLLILLLFVYIYIQESLFSICTYKRFDYTRFIFLQCFLYAYIDRELILRVYIYISMFKYTPFVFKFVYPRTMTIFIYLQDDIEEAQEAVEKVTNVYEAHVREVQNRCDIPLGPDWFIGIRIMLFFLSLYVTG